jgi:hypothetical protein
MLKPMMGVEIGRALGENETEPDRKKSLGRKDLSHMHEFSLLLQR